MDIKEKAKSFAINAHKDQVRKNEPDKPMVMHPISVANLLEEYGYDVNVIAAGYLHDVVEDTKFTIEEIEKEFGKDVSSLVYDASEPDKSLSWEERKMHTIRAVKDLPLRNKLVVCADKINNLEDLFITFEKTGVRDFSRFNANEEKIKWYYTSVYKSLIHGEDENLPIFKRLKNALDMVFYKKENTYLKDVIFEGDEDYYNRLKKLHAAKIELQRLKALSKLSKPYVIEFSGTPRTGKTTIMNNLYDFFRKGGFDVSLIEEFTTSKYYKQNLEKRLNALSRDERNVKIFELVLKQLLEEFEKNKEIVLVESSLNDRQIWLYTLLKNKQIDFRLYNDTREKYKYISKDLIDFLVITYADSLTSLKRAYSNSLALEDQRFLNVINIESFNESLKALKNLFNGSTDEVYYAVTTDTSIRDASIQITSEILPDMRKKYIKSFKNKYNLR